MIIIKHITHSFETLAVYYLKKTLARSGCQKFLFAGEMGSKTSKKGKSSLIQSYLIGYNGIQTLGWSYLLYQLINYYTTPQTIPLYEAIKWTMIIFQNAAILEVVHAVIGIVPSNPILTGVQIASRVGLICCALLPFQAPRDSVGLPLALLAWSITEVIRYSTYTSTLLGTLPYFLKFLRYTMFIVLYPIGITGELLCLYAAQAVVAETNFLSISMPNKSNFIFSYRYFLLIVMFSYIPFFPQLYGHMLSQRRKVLGGQKKEK